jgi:hypothetical protein
MSLQKCTKDISIIIPENGCTSPKFFPGRLVVPRSGHKALWKFGVVRERTATGIGIVLQIIDLEHQNILYEDALEYIDCVVPTDRLMDDATNNRNILPWLVIPTETCKVPWRIAEVINFKDDGALFVKDIMTKEEYIIRDTYVRTLARG